MPQAFFFLFCDYIFLNDFCKSISNLDFVKIKTWLMTVTFFPKQNCKKRWIESGKPTWELAHMTPNSTVPEIDRVNSKDHMMLWENFVGQPNLTLILCCHLCLGTKFFIRFNSVKSFENLIEIWMLLFIWTDSFSFKDWELSRRWN